MWMCLLTDQQGRYVINKNGIFKWALFVIRIFARDNLSPLSLVVPLSTGPLHPDHSKEVGSFGEICEKKKKASSEKNRLILEYEVSKVNTGGCCLIWTSIGYYWRRIWWAGRTWRHWARPYKYRYRWWWTRGSASVIYHSGIWGVNIDDGNDNRGLKDVWEDRTNTRRLLRFVRSEKWLMGR